MRNMRNSPLCLVGLVAAVSLVTFMSGCIGGQKKQEGGLSQKEDVPPSAASSLLDLFEWRRDRADSHAHHHGETRHYDVDARASTGGDRPFDRRGERRAHKNYKPDYSRRGW